MRARGGVPGTIEFDRDKKSRWYRSQTVCKREAVCSLAAVNYYGITSARRCFWKRVVCVIAGVIRFSNFCVNHVAHTY